MSFIPLQRSSTTRSYYTLGSLLFPSKKSCQNHFGTDRRILCNFHVSTRTASSQHQQQEPKLIPSPPPSSSIIGIGIDLLYLPRLQTLLGRHKLRLIRKNQSLPPSSLEIKAMSHLAKRILCLKELNQWNQMISQQNDDDQGLLRFLAVHWTIKEATYKALYPNYIVSWKHLCISKPHPPHGEVLKNRTRKPKLEFSTEWYHEKITKLPIVFHLSVSHDGEYVVANVVAESISASTFNWEEMVSCVSFSQHHDKQKQKEQFQGEIDS